ncbi:hypothetical protein D7X74_07405 [Corallococcus sp. CA047B]|uniref:hypothetical protein n=1 Tax=Corallococcus sp. CA047B TaxID=2316729 RepID=UPI000EA21678|nr:hypothetical protein [Corallococcus sp. CA047B]RKH19237.1 hypothetical protein D7X74_07405 [Corallococcus sp. CA047B]
MSEASHFFAALVTSPAVFRKTLERARLQAVLDVEPAGDAVAPSGPGATPAVPGPRWVAFASPGENREALGKLTERLVEVFDEGGDWSLGFFMDQAKLTLRSEDLEPSVEDRRTSARRHAWLLLFLGRTPDEALAALSTGGAFAFCEALEISFLELVDQEMVPWEALSREFPDRYTVASWELAD